MTEERSPKETGMRDVPKNLKPYFLGLLRRGPRWNETEGPEATGLIQRQLSYLREHSEAGRYLAAGPVMDEGEFTGVLLIAAATYKAAHPVLLPDLDAVRAVYEPPHKRKTKSGK
jgi:hypothetical protein